MSKKNSLKKKNISRDCWNLDTAFLKWLSERLPIYLKEGGKVVDLTWHTFTYKDKEYNQRELIEKMISLLNEAKHFTNFSSESQYVEIVNEILDIWKLVFHCMWW